MEFNEMNEIKEWVMRSSRGMLTLVTVGAILASPSARAETVDADIAQNREVPQQTRAQLPNLSAELLAVRNAFVTLVNRAGVPEAVIWDAIRSNRLQDLDVPPGFLAESLVLAHASVRSQSVTGPTAESAATTRALTTRVSEVEPTVNVSRRGLPTASRLTAGTGASVEYRPSDTGSPPARGSVPLTQSSSLTEFSPGINISRQTTQVSAHDLPDDGVIESSPVEANPSASNISQAHDHAPVDCPEGVERHNEYVAVAMADFARQTAVGAFANPPRFYAQQGPSVADMLYQRQGYVDRLRDHVQAMQPPDYWGPIRQEELSLSDQAKLAAGGEDAYIRRLIEIRERYDITWLTSDEINRMIIDPSLVHEWFGTDPFADFEDDGIPDGSQTEDPPEIDFDGDHTGPVGDLYSDDEEDTDVGDDDSESDDTEETDEPMSYYERQAQEYRDRAGTSREQASDHRDQAAAARASAQAARERAGAATSDENRAWWEQQAADWEAHAELLDDTATLLEESAARDEERAENPAQAGSSDTPAIDETVEVPAPPPEQESSTTQAAGQNSPATVDATETPVPVPPTVPRWVLRDPDSPYLRDPVARIGIPPRIIRDRRGRVAGRHDGNRLTLTIPIGTSEEYEAWPYGWVRRERPEEYRKLIEGLQMPGQELVTFIGLDGLPIYHLADNIVEVQISADDPRVEDIERLALEVANGEYNWGEFAWALTQAGLDDHPSFTALDQELTDRYADQSAMDHAGNYVNGTDREREDLNMLLLAAEPNGAEMGRQPLPSAPGRWNSGRRPSRQRGSADTDLTPNRTNTADDATSSRTSVNDSDSRSSTTAGGRTSPYTPCLDRRPMTASTDPIGDQPRLQGVDAAQASEVRSALNQIRRTDLTRETDCWGGSMHLRELAGRGSVDESNATSRLTRMDHTMLRIGNGNSVEYIDTRPGMWRKHFAENPEIRATLERQVPGLPARLEQGAVLTGDEFLLFHGNRPAPRSPMFDQNPIPSSGN